MKRLALLNLAAATVFMAPGLAAQGLPQSDRHEIHSAALGATRPFMVSVPSGYERSATRYPVLYVLDGPSHFYYVIDQVRYLAGQGRAPQMIVVAIPNTDDRTRDLTPPSETENAQTGFPTAGGADRFLTFLADELIPHIDSTYRTDDFRVLVGHSFGGLFAAHTILTRPEVFRGYIAISPTLWWNRKTLVDRLASHAETWTGPKVWLYLTSGSFEADILNSVTQLTGKLKSASPQFWWRFKYMPKENHGSIPFRSIFDGLEGIFAEGSISDSARFDIVASPNAGAAMQKMAILDEQLRSASQVYGREIRVPEVWINQLGYGFLGRGDARSAVVIFKENVSRYPESANAYDSLGDAYLVAGDVASAREAFSEAVRRAKESGDPVLSASERKLRQLDSTNPPTRPPDP